MLGVAKTPAHSTHPLSPPTPSGQTYMGATSEPCGPPSRPPSPLGPDNCRELRAILIVADRPSNVKSTPRSTSSGGWADQAGGPAAVAWLAAPEISRVAQGTARVAWSVGQVAQDEASRVSTQPSSHPAVQPTTPPRSQPTSCPARQTENQPLGCRSLAASSPGNRSQDSDRFQTDPYRVFGNRVYEKYKNGGTSWAEKRA